MSNAETPHTPNHATVTGAHLRIGHLLCWTAVSNLALGHHLAIPGVQQPLPEGLGISVAGALSPLGPALRLPWQHVLCQVIDVLHDGVHLLRDILRGCAEVRG